MNKRSFAAAALLAVALSAHAAPPSTQSIDTLLTATRAQLLLDSLYGNAEQAMRQGMQAATAGHSLTPEQQRVFDSLPGQFVKIMREELNWTRLKPIYVSIYQDTLSQEEVDAMIAFYTSPAGAAVIEKMPLVMQRSMQSTQTLMQPLLQKMLPMIEQAMRDAKVGG
ncbi:MAG: DUF2059 domain-containing protein [Pseudomonadota bacterium]|nr:DUF2059 domain-containing protein [Pseudomonadota bacterium]